MPVEYCIHCESPRPMHVAVSRIQVSRRGGPEVTTATCYCRCCGSFLPGSGKDGKEALIRAGSLPASIKALRV